MLNPAAFYELSAKVQTFVVLCPFHVAANFSVYIGHSHPRSFLSAARGLCRMQVWLPTTQKSCPDPWSQLTALINTWQLLLMACVHNPLPTPKHTHTPLPCIVWGSSSRPSLRLRPSPPPCPLQVLGGSAFEIVGFIINSVGQDQQF